MRTVARWFPGLDPADRSRIRLFCFPHAGGSTAVFYSWRAALHGDVQVLPVELPGHRGRLEEPPYRSIDSLVDAFVPAVRSMLDRPYALLGTSMGGLIAFEVAKRLQAHGHEPKRLIVASSPAPRTRFDQALHRLPDEEFLERLRAMRATPPEVLASDELKALLLPAWRADFAMVETYAYRPTPPLRVPLTVVRGRDDPYVRPEQAAGWRQETTGPFELVEVEGDHFFFLDRSSTTLLTLLAERLADAIAEQ